MANKKISQLNQVDGTVGVTSSSLFPMASGYAGNYETAACDALDIAKFCLSPMPANMLNQPIGFTGNVDINFKKDSWDTASTIVEDNPYLQVRMEDGQLVTGSGVAVPAALGDNMGDCVATRDVDMQGFDISGLDDVKFKNDEDHPISFISNVHSAGKLRMQAGNDLFLSGNRHVIISGQALSLEDGDTQTPISGNVVITGGDVEIDPGNRLTANVIEVLGVPPFGAYGSKILLSGGGDYATLKIEDGAISTVPRHIVGVGDKEVDWRMSNVRYDTTAGSEGEYSFSNVEDGQTLTMYLENTHPSSSASGTFVHTSAIPVLWGAEYVYNAPIIAVGKTNVYTFVRINTGIFASAVTGYDY